MKQEMNLAQFSRTLFWICLIVCGCFAMTARAQTNVFTYQGRLTDSQTSGNGSYLMEFKLFANPTSVEPIDTLSDIPVTVTNNIFTAQLNFTAVNAFSGGDRYLQISVKRTAGDAYTTLSPMQRLTSIPYAIRARQSTTADNALAVGGTPAAEIIKEGDARLTDSRTPTAGSGDYVQNTTTEQAATNFNIGGTGAANIFNARTQFNINGFRAFTMYNGNTFAGIYAGENDPVGGNNSYFGREAGLLDATGSANSFFGAYAGRVNGGSYNSIFGYDAGAGNGTGSRNIFFGVSVGRTNTSGSNNTVIGAYADVGSGDLNFATAIGAGATVNNSNSVVLGRAIDTVRIPGTLNVNTFSADTLSANTVNAATQYNIGGNRVLSANATNTFVGLFTGGGGSANAFFGSDVGRFNTGSLNSFFGNGAGNSNLTGNENSFFGRGAGVDNTSGSSNSFFGFQAGADNTTGNDNAFFGWQAGISNITGNNNTVLGTNANVGANNLTFATAVGAGAVVRTNNTIVLGRADGSDKVRLSGLGTGGTTALCRNADNEISTCASVNPLAEENRANVEQINQLREQVKQQQVLIDELKKLVCASNPKAAICQ